MQHGWTTWAGVVAAALGVAEACDSADGDEATVGTSSGAGGAGGFGGEAGAGAASGGAGGMDALDVQCTPTVTIELEDASETGAVFTDAVPDPEPFVQETGRTVCRILYRSPEEVRDANHITLIVRNDPEYPGWKSGDVGDITVMISTYYLAEVEQDGRDVATEIRGVLLHEMTHMYQNDDKAPGEGSYGNLPNVVEAVADFVRIRAGYLPNGAYASKDGQWDDEGYWKPAFFLLWIDGQVLDFLHDMNLAMEAGDGQAWTPESIETITGRTVDDWWAEYANVSCCDGQMLTCCV